MYIYKYLIIHVPARIERLEFLPNVYIYIPDIHIYIFIQNLNLLIFIAPVLRICLTILSEERVSLFIYHMIHVI